jgi:hypothetical protein
MSRVARAFARGRVALAGALVGALTGATAPAPGQTITDDFSNGDGQWQRYTPLTAVFGAGAPASFTITEKQEYQIGSANPPSNAAGPARAGSLRTQATYTDFYQQVDLTEWTGFQDQAVGLLARVTNYQGGAPGQLNGYALTYSTGDNSLLLSRVVAEDPQVVDDQTIPAALVVGQDYRLVFRGEGNVFRGAIYDLNDLATPLQTVEFTDGSPLAPGIGGLVVFSNVDTSGAGASFDNYLSSPPPPVPEPASAATVLLGIAAALTARRRTR